MLIVINNLLDKNAVRECRAQLDAAEWLDGRLTAGVTARQVKQNQQLADDNPAAVAIGKQLLGLLMQQANFISAALPLRIHPPKFNRYADGGHYGNHVDNAVMKLPGSSTLMRSDLSATIFLSEPDEYDGGELVIETRFGAPRVKLPAGSMVLYSSSSKHQVTPVTRGARVCAFFWLQSMVADDEQRTLLFDLDRSIRTLNSTAAGQPAQKDALLSLNGVYQNLVRRWANT